MKTPGILAKICAQTRQDLEKRKKSVPARMLEKAVERAEPALDFSAALSGSTSIAVIAEIKKASPSAGLISHSFDPVRIARLYESEGAAAISVLTDEPFFQGSLDYLRRVKKKASLPLLRKDFILDPYQVLEARTAGADAVLLIVAALRDKELLSLSSLAAATGMHVLVEVHDAEELARAANAGAAVIGINNRNLHTFEVNLDTTVSLAPRIPAGSTLVSESGVKTRDDVLRLAEAGVDAVLVGETLMRAPDMRSALRELASVSRHLSD